MDDHEHDKNEEGNNLSIAIVIYKSHRVAPSARVYLSVKAGLRIRRSVHVVYAPCIRAVLELLRQDACIPPNHTMWLDALGRKQAMPSLRIAAQLHMK